MAFDGVGCCLLTYVDIYVYGLASVAIKSVMACVGEWRDDLEMGRLRRGDSPGISTLESSVESPRI